MREGDEKDAHEDKHLDEAEPLQLAQDHGPRVEEDRLDVENDEQHRRQVEAHRQAAVGGGVGDDPGLVWGHLAFRRARWAEHEAQGNERYHEPEDDQDEDEQWDVALEQVSEAASGIGAFGNRLNSIGALRNAVEGRLVRVLMPMFDLRAMRKRRVDRTVAIAGQVDSLLDALLFVLAVPRGHERDLDLLERARPVLLLLAFDLDSERFQRLLELLEQEDGVHAGASGQRAEQHLGGRHRLEVTKKERY